jgi:hypothetical protein
VTDYPLGEGVRQFILSHPQGCEDEAEHAPYCLGCSKRWERRYREVEDWLDNVLNDNEKGGENTRQNGS